MAVQPYETNEGTRWLFVFNGPPKSTGGRNQIKRRGFRTAKDAELAEAREREKVKDMRPAADGTVAAELRAWLTEREVDARPTTQDTYRSRLEDYVIPTLGRKPLRALADAKTINTLYRHLVDAGSKRGGPLAPTTVHGVHRTLMTALSDLGVVVEGKVRLPAGGGKKGRRGVWDDAQCAAFLAHVRAERLFAAWSLSVVCAIRRGELAGLRWRHLDLDAGVLTLRRQRNARDGGNGVVEQSPKGDRERSIPLGPLLVAVLVAHRQRWREERERAGEEWEGEDYVFVSQRRPHRPYYPGYFSSRFVLLTEAAGLPRIALHDARHSSASVSSAAGVDLKTLQDRVGHADARTLTEVYLHALPPAARAAALAIESVLLRPAA